MTEEPDQVNPHCRIGKITEWTPIPEELREINGGRTHARTVYFGNPGTLKIQAAVMMGKLREKSIIAKILKGESA